MSTQVDIKRRISIIEALTTKKCFSCYERMDLLVCSKCNELSLNCIYCLHDHIIFLLTELDIIIGEVFANNKEEEYKDDIKGLVSHYQDIKTSIENSIVICKDCMTK
jgi:hypothetical protein